MGRLNREPKELAKEVAKIATNPDIEFNKTIAKSIRFDKVVSTGSTLLDCAISGNRIYGGGIPGGIVVEIFGPSAHGKTLLVVEICSSAEAKGGLAEFNDPEGRLDKEYARLTNGLDLSAKGKYRRSKTVEEVFERVEEWVEEEGSGEIDVMAVDSLAALSTEVEMEDEDKRGQMKAKKMSESLRKNALNLAQERRLLVCTNQIRQGSTPQGKPKEIVPGGEAFPFYASLRIRIGPPPYGKGGTFKIEDEVKLDKGKAQKVIGIHPYAYCIKNTCDDPYREVPLYIIFGYGIDDVRANLQWIKDIKGNTQYDCITKDYSSMKKAIQYIEENNLQADLRKQTIDLWMEIEAKFDQIRSPKVRF
jgi:RecA/RadA recombinase